MTTKITTALKIFKILLRTVLWIAAGAVFVVLAAGVAAYIPSVQRFAAGKAAAIVARETGMRVAVGDLRVRFPLGVTVEGVEVLSAEGDTLAHVERARARARVLPLLRGNVRVTGVEVTGLRAAWRDTTSGMSLTARVDRFAVGSVRMDSRLKRVSLSRASIDGGEATVAMGTGAERMPQADTAAFDWNIDVGRFDLSRFALALDMPDGAADAAGTIESAEPPPFDYRHIRVGDAAVSVRDLRYGGDRMSVRFDDLALAERSGLRVVDGGGEFLMTQEAFTLDDLTIETAASKIEGNATVGAGIVRMEGDTPVEVRLSATVSPDEAALFVPVPRAVRDALAGRAATLRGEVTGTPDDLSVWRLAAEVPGRLTIDADGALQRILSPDHLAGSVRIEGNLADIDFARELIPDPELRRRVTLPHGMTLAAEADFTMRSVDLRSASLRLDSARIEAAGRFDLDTQSYAADLRAVSFPVDRFLPGDSIGVVAGRLAASGRGFDPATLSATVNLTLDRARYGTIELGRVAADVTADGGVFRGRVESRSALVDGGATVEGSVGRDTLWTAREPSRNSHTATAPLSYRLAARLDSTYVLSGGVRLLVGPADIDAAASPAGTRMSISSGDLSIDVASPLAPDTLVRGGLRASAEIERQLAARNFNADSLQGAFPSMTLTVRAGRANFMREVVRAYGADYRSIRADAAIGTSGPFRIDAAVVSPTTGSIGFDTVSLHAIRNADRLDYSLRMANRRAEVTEPGLIRVGGSVGGNSLTANVVQKNSVGTTGFDFTLTASLADSTVRVELAPDPTLGYEKWLVGTEHDDFHHTAGEFDHPTAGEGNWLESDLDGKLRADLHLTSEKAAAAGKGGKGGGAAGTGIMALNWGGAGAVASVIANTRRHISLTSSSLPGISDGAVRLSLSGLDVAPMLDLFPTMPRLGGVLSSDLTVGFHPATDDAPSVVAARGTLGVGDFSYEGQRVADMDTVVDFGTDGGGRMVLDASVMLEKQTALTAKGTYAEGSVDFTVDVPSVPLTLAQRMLPPGAATLSGYLNGRLHIAGDPSKPAITGDVGIVDGRARANMLGTSFGISPERVKIADNRVTFDDWGLTAPNNQRLRVNGSVDISDAAAPAVDLAIRAINFRFVDSSHIGGSQVYGRAALSADVSARGRLDAMMVRGDVRIADDTDVVYIMREESDIRDERQHIVRFTSFEADSLAAGEDELPLPSRRAGVDMLLRVVAREGAKATVSLDEANENRVELIGGGDLSMSVNREGDVRLAGRYVLSGGTLHYRPPLIPQKVFAVSDGSYVEWRGKPLEPELHISASQSTRVRLDHEDGASEDADFDITADITGSLSGMDIRFDLSSPDNMVIQDQLLAMSAEGRMQQALSMMIYNRYSGPGVASKGMAIDARGQINDFISREINQWARNGLRGVDFSMGIKTSDDALGEGVSRTDYSYSVSKSLLDDRMKITIGGSVSDRGANDAGNLLEDIELEYRLNRRENMFFKLYRFNTRASMLEGEVTETGAGFVIRKKVTRIKNMFKRTAPPRRSPARRAREDDDGSDGERPDTLQGTRRNTPQGGRQTERER